jgi:hypothetical protein
MHARGVVQWGGGCPTQPAMWEFCRPGRAGGDCAESATQGWVRHDPQTIALVDRCAPQLAAFDHRRAATAVVNLHVGPNPQGLGVP